jgi:hypothetical protein
MLFNRLTSLFPGWRTFLTITLSAAVGALVSIGISNRLRAPDGPVPTPQPPHDRRFVALGRAYLPQLGKAYAAAWEEGAKALDAAQGISSALDVVAKAWTSQRSQLFDKHMAQEFAKVIPEGVKDTELTPQERAALAAAWRGFALGLSR